MSRRTGLNTIQRKLNLLERKTRNPALNAPKARYRCIGGPWYGCEILLTPPAATGMLLLIDTSDDGDGLIYGQYRSDRDHCNPPAAEIKGKLTSLRSSVQWHPLPDEALADLLDRAGIEGASNALHRRVVAASLTPGPVTDNLEELLHLAGRMP